jgi:hypothetical protein
MAPGLPRLAAIAPIAGVGREQEKESDAESIYESRKLLIRQMQGQIAKQVSRMADPGH